VAKRGLRSLKLHDFDLKEVDASRSWHSVAPPQVEKIQKPTANQPLPASQNIPP
jgi:hypothetical protein